MNEKLLALKPYFSATAAWVLSFALIFGCFYRSARGIAKRNAAVTARLYVRAGINRIEARLGPAQEAARGLAAVLEEAPPGREGMLRLLKSAVERVPEVSAGVIALEPRSKGSVELAPRYQKEAGLARLTWLGNKTHRYSLLDWYQLPRELGRPAWTEPSADESGRLTATYSVPFFRKAGKHRRVAGVVALEVPLGEIQREVESIHLLKTGHAVLLSQDGGFIARGDGKPDMAATVFSRAEGLGDKHLRELGRRMVRGAAGRTPEVSFGPVPSTGWSLAVVTPKREVVARVNRLAWLALSLANLGLGILLAVLAAERR